MRILIIDDEWSSRKKTYENVLSNDLEIVAVENGSELFDKIQKVQVDGYLVDMVLDKWRTNDDKPQELIPVLERIGIFKPIFLVSRQIGTLVENNQLTSIINKIIEKGLLLKSFFAWNDFEKENRLKNNLVQTSNINKTILVHILSHVKIEKQKEEKIADIGIVCALNEELMPFLSSRENLFPAKDETIEGISIPFKRGVITTKSNKKIKYVAVISPFMGMVDCSYSSSILISEFKIKHLFMIGVCGGRDTEDIGIGDIIIPRESVAYQQGKLDDSNFILNPSYAPQSSNIMSSIGSDNECMSGYLENINRKYRQVRQAEAKLYSHIPVIHEDEMACGEVVVNKMGELDKIANEVNRRKLCSIDMESYALYRSNFFFNNVKVTLIKSVMDKTKNKNDKYKSYAAHIASEYLHELLYNEKICINNNSHT